MNPLLLMQLLQMGGQAAGKGADGVNNAEAMLAATNAMEFLTAGAQSYKEMLNGIHETLSYFGEKKSEQDMLKSYMEKLRGSITGDYQVLEEGGVVETKNVNVEGGEAVVSPDNIVGEVKGKKHSEGGVDAELQDGTIVFSDKLKVGRAKSVLKEFVPDVSGKDTFADVVLKFEEKIGVSGIESQLKSLLKKIDEQNDIEDKNTASVNKKYLLSKVNELSAKLEEKKQEIDKFKKLVLMLQYEKSGGKNGEPTSAGVKFEDGGVVDKELPLTGDPIELLTTPEFVDFINKIVEKQRDNKVFEFLDNFKKSKGIGGGELQIVPNADDNSGLNRIMNWLQMFFTGGLRSNPTIGRRTAFTGGFSGGEFGGGGASGEWYPDDDVKSLDGVDIILPPLVDWGVGQDLDLGLRPATGTPFYSMFADKLKSSELQTNNKISDVPKIPITDSKKVKKDEKKKPTQNVKVPTKSVVNDDWLFLRDEYQLPPDKQLPHLLSKVNLDRLDKRNMSPEEYLKAIGRSQKMAQESLNEIPDSVRRSAVANIVATSEGNKNKAISDVDLKNLMANAQIDKLNLMQSNDETKYNEGARLAYERNTYLARANTLQDWRNWFDTNRAIDISMDKERRMQKFLNDYYENFNIDAFGRIGLDAGNQRKFYLNMQNPGIVLNNDVPKSESVSLNVKDFDVSDGSLNENLDIKNKDDFEQVKREPSDRDNKDADKNNFYREMSEDDVKKLNALKEAFRILNGGKDHGDMLELLDKLKKRRGLNQI